MPHDKLGEEVAAAVVLREGQAASEQELREFAAERLADFKVPRRSCSWRRSPVFAGWASTRVLLMRFVLLRSL